MLDESDRYEQPTLPWVAGNPGFVHAHLPYRICDEQRDYGYFATIEQARTALAAMRRPTVAPPQRDEGVDARFVALWKELATLSRNLSESADQAARHARLLADLNRRLLLVEQAKDQ